MPCFYPMTAYRSIQGRNPVTGLWPIVFDVKEGYIDMPVEVPCGKCIGCRLERSRQWAIRCVNEASLHSENCFITLTYDNEHLPEDQSLSKKHIQRFWRNLRKKGFKFRYFSCGEYGESLKRPHYHACIFGMKPKDLVLWNIRDGVKLFNSKALSDSWGKGFVTVGEVTFESAAYVARYVMKKITGEQAEEHYKGRQKEFILMSRKPGIGKDWFLTWKDDVIKVDGVVIRGGRTVRPGRYYDSIYDKINHKEMEKIKRIRKTKINPEENTYQRRLTKEKSLKIKLSKLKRSIENAV